MNNSATTKKLEERLRRLLVKQGYQLKKSRARTMKLNDFCIYQIIDLNNCIVAGERFDLSLEEVAKFAFEE